MEDNNKNNDTIVISKSRFDKISKLAKINNNAIIKMAKEYCTFSIKIDINVNTDSVNEPIKIGGFCMSNVAPSTDSIHSFIKTMNNEVSAAVNKVKNEANKELYEKYGGRIKKVEEDLSKYKEMFNKIKESYNKISDLYKSENDMLKNTIVKLRGDNATLENKSNKYRNLFYAMSVTSAILAITTIISVILYVG